MKKTLVLFSLILGLAVSGLAIDDARLLRMPDINGDLIVFVYAGDIWSVPANGGDARKLTSHLGREIYPKISPDGRWIAFSAEYSGSRQIYVMPAAGGSPRQLTFYNDVGMMPPRGGFDNMAMDWTPDSKAILFRANRTPYGRRMGKYFLVNLDGGLETPLQIPEAGGGTFSPTGKEIVYTPISREFRTWKRYQGGWAQDLYLFELDGSGSQNITNHIRTDRDPMWAGEDFNMEIDTAANVGQSYLSQSGISGLGLVNDGNFMLRATLQQGGGGGGSCVQDLENGVVCLRNGRFEFVGTWTDFSNPPVTQPLIWTLVEDINATAGFQNNPSGIQIVMRVADGCRLTGTWWVWLGGFTDAGWNITVRDTVTGNTQTFTRNRQSGSFPTTTRDMTTFSCN